MTSINSQRFVFVHHLSGLPLGRAFLGVSTIVVSKPPVRQSVCWDKIGMRLNDANSKSNSNVGSRFRFLKKTIFDLLRPT